MQQITQIDLQSSNAAISAVVMGFFFLDSNSYGDKDHIRMEIIFWVLLVINLVFLFRWIRMFTLIYFDKVKNYLQKQEFRGRNNGETKVLKYKTTQSSRRPI
jgi:hypothetical protein